MVSALVMAGAKINRVEQRRADLRFPFPEGFAARLAGREITHVGRRAKYLLLDLSGDEVLVMHLGMSGSFRVDEASPGRFHHARDRSAAHDHVVFHIEGGARVIYNDARRFGFMVHAIGRTILFFAATVWLTAVISATPVPRLMGPIYRVV